MILGVDPGAAEGACAVIDGARVSMLAAWWRRTRGGARETVVWHYLAGTAYPVATWLHDTALISSRMASFQVVRRGAVEGHVRGITAGRDAHLLTVGRAVGALLAVGCEVVTVEPRYWRRAIGVTQTRGEKAVDAAVRAWSERTFDLPPGIPPQAMRSIPDALGVAWWAQHQEVSRG